MQTLSSFTFGLLNRGQRFTGLSRDPYSRSLFPHAHPACTIGRKWFISKELSINYQTEATLIIIGNGLLINSINSPYLIEEGSVESNWSTTQSFMLSPSELKSGRFRGRSNYCQDQLIPSLTILLSSLESKNSRNMTFLHSQSVSMWNATEFMWHTKGFFSESSRHRDECCCKPDIQVLMIKKIH